MSRELFTSPQGPGKTPQCSGCVAITRNKTAVPHWESCRERVEAWIMRHDPEKYYRELEKYAKEKAEEKERLDKEIIEEARRKRPRSWGRKLEYRG